MDFQSALLIRMLQLGSECLLQRPENASTKFKKDAYGMDLEVLDEEEDEDREDSKSLPPEATQAENEAFALHFKARQKIADVRTLRQ